MTNYLKLLLISLLMVSLMGFTWAVTMGCGPFIKLGITSSFGYNTLIGLGVLLVTGIGFTVSRNESLKTILAGMAFGALCGTFTCFCIWFGEIIAESRGGFWTGLLYWFICTIGVGACSAAMAAAVKNALFSAIRLDFFVVLTCIIIGTSTFFSGMSLFINAFQFHILVGLGVIIGLSGSAAGLAAPAIESPVVMDNHGNMHFVTSNITNNEIMDTNGGRMRKMPDGTYKNL